ncbi:MAG: outer membrane protein assembly factor BamE [Pseudomonadota bacterium]|nr:outer membrane protein assembly factor BamE [Pseudomonadota bacterium]
MITRVTARAVVRVAPLALASFAMTGCATLDRHAPSWRSLGVYKIDVNQGNYLSQDVIDKLKAGMTPQQVKQLLGTPLITSPFRADRWDYVYEFIRQGQVVEHRNFTVYFAEGKVARWEGDQMPETVVELNQSASAKALPVSATGEKSFWQRFLDLFRR